ncbi:type I methionyl aminopeptidase [Anoxybacterium hadale]|uniref:Type I methionyl aminopeptidase n=1 Tax=Anoxybacterium hadale TaxID=3408580 RepID=A0ACD1AEA0_9FIRM|nr:type I methionyl aminopeptidase [Clostridiales bacterium]
MTVSSEKERKALEKIGKIVSIAREEMIKAVKPGITTKELDEIGGAVLSEFGATSAPKSEYNFPGITCISVNDQAAHGIPGPLMLKFGDMVNVDVSAELDGYFADTGATVVLDRDAALKNKLCDCSKAALMKSISRARAGCRLNLIGKTIYEEAQNNGFTVIKNLGGHGIGRRLHEDPAHILNYYSKWDARLMRSGLVLAVETFLSTKAEYVTEAKDGWTLKTPDGSLVAQFEHTIIVTDGEPIILTA